VIWHLSVHPDVAADADEAIAYYAEFDIDLPRALIDEVDGAMAFMQQYWRLRLCGSACPGIW